MGFLIFRITTVLFCFALFSGEALSQNHGISFKDFPIKGKVNMIDLGAKKCIPCKKMAPILSKLEEAYKGKAAVIFIDVWKHKEQANRFKIRAIPTQIFFDEKGVEKYRHIGFMGEKAITEQFKKMGVDSPGQKSGM